MTGSNRFALTMICFSLVIAASMLIKKPASSEQAEPKLLTKDYAQMNAAVKEVLKDMPEIKEELEFIRSGVNANETDTLFTVKKAEFRIRVENNFTKQEHSPEFMRSMAERENGRYWDALRIAEEEYGVKVEEEEVTEFIKEYAAAVRSKEKERYAEVLDLTLEELDYQFDRDFYVMDLLWKKLMPLVEEKYPMQEGESKKTYSERVKEEFLNEEG
ncbi:MULTISPECIES: hypothetical protein [unclassified Sporosarcina]|uniref:hypothetical protein n=1 Tax=unclassified Sporosarcina TaxID=2647733 RepID=UPI00203AEDEB|nr:MULTISPECIES: hypothetical protein [unclassified Sporosarcina]GKV66530.1 hypothetical protein NCCP2331_26830 [Sporosarcina sp. NCCP-2331]GLB56807.1 hypothetical protein NCCP2378_25940 [Sporosarcina sp. NCCP-2378]